MDTMRDLAARVDAMAQSFAARVPLAVLDHAMWRAAERFPGFRTETIEDEVREALAAGRVTIDRGPLGLHPKSDPTCLYVWTADGDRIYAMRVDALAPDGFAIITTMRRRDR